MFTNKPDGYHPFVRASRTDAKCSVCHIPKDQGPHIERVKVVTAKSGTRLMWRLVEP